MGSRAQARRAFLLATKEKRQALSARPERQSSRPHGSPRAGAKERRDRRRPAAARAHCLFFSACCLQGRMCVYCRNDARCRFPVNNRRKKTAPSTTLADFSRARDSQITFSVTHGWSAFWRGRPWLAERRIGETSLAVGSSRFWIGWVTRHGDKCARSTCRG